MSSKVIFTRQHIERFVLWIAIGLIVNYTCYGLESESPRYTIAFMNAYFDPLDLIFFASSHCMALILGGIFHAPYHPWGPVLWIVLGLVMLIATFVHLGFFLIARRSLFYALIILQIVGIAWAADCEIEHKHMTAPVVAIPRT